MNQRVDVQKGKEVVVFRHFMAWDFSCHNLAEYCCHDL
jgi:hypothetical protein